MTLAFSNFSVIIKRKSLVDNFFNNSNGYEGILEMANNLISSNFSDNYLIGIESLSENLYDEFYVLEKLGLNWHDGENCLDFFIPSKGSTTATWLNFERIRINNFYYSSYSHIDDLSDDIIFYDGALNFKRQKNLIQLNRRNWALVARDELNRLYTPSLDEFKNEISCNKRVCPIPKLWNELYEIANEADINNSTQPPLPLILGSWWESENSERSVRLNELVDWAFQNNVSDVVWAYVKSLKENEWHHTND
jgi:hypothetical protein